MPGFIFGFCGLVIVAFSFYFSKRITDARKYQFFINLVKFNQKIVDLRFKPRPLQQLFVVQFTVAVDFCGKAETDHEVGLSFVDVLVLYEFSLRYSDCFANENVLLSLDAMNAKMKFIIKEADYERQCDWAKSADKEFNKLNKTIERKTKKSKIKIVDEFISHVSLVKKEAA